MSAEEHKALKEEVAGLHRKIDRASSAILDLTARMASMESGSTSEYTPTRTFGYVNWGPCHNVIKTQVWVKQSKIMLYIRGPNMYLDDVLDMPSSHYEHRVTENTRFPQDGVYVNIYCPRVIFELDALKNKNYIAGPEAPFDRLKATARMTATPSAALRNTIS